MVQQEKYFVLQSISFNTFAGLFQGIPPEIQQIINDYSELVWRFLLTVSSAAYLLSELV